MFSNIFNDKCSNTLVFLISQMKLIKITEKLGLDLTIEIRTAVLITTSTRKGGDYGTI